ncbi:MAG TPA: NAD(+)/NADH kinase [Longimicrobiales bacterium]|nr:NAD(+)/NADH kinase [Longimicrobiales bacterium]
MRAAAQVIRRIGIVAQERYAGLPQAIDRLGDFARKSSIELLAEPELSELLPGAAGFDPAEIDLLITMGGDGTLLRGARLVAESHVPVLGVNFGHLGFLTSIAPDELEAGLASVLGGNYWLDERFTLDAVVEAKSGERAGSYNALNDAVLHKGGFARVVRLAVFIGPDRQEIGSYTADGIIVATPTGSTAYSLSAGGPIVVPTVDCILATPICPHTLVIRPLVIPASEEILVEVLTPTSEMILTIDGQDGEHLQPGDRLIVCRGQPTVRLVRLPGQTFFKTLRRKLHWAVQHSETRV